MPAAPKLLEEASIVARLKHLARGWIRHPHRSRVAWAQRCANDHDIYACLESGWTGSEESAGLISFEFRVPSFEFRVSSFKFRVPSEHRTFRDQNLRPQT